MFNARIFIYVWIIISINNMADKEREKEVGKEKEIDYNFRVASVEGQGSGLGFQLENLSLPRNHENLIKALNPKVDLSEALNRIFSENRSQFSLSQGHVEFKNNLLTQIVFGGLGDSPRLFLDERRTDIDTGMGTYRFENVDNIYMALVLTKTISEYLNFLEQDDRYAYVDRSGGNWGGYFSANLTLPKDLAEKAKKSDNAYFRERFALEASNIAGRFGVTVRTLHFENQFLQYFDIKEGDACDYGIHESSFPRYSYAPHNVDNPWQAMALHGIGAAYINRLLDIRSAEKEE